MIRIPRKLVWFSAVIVFLVITALSLMPPKNGLEIPGNDKVGHFLAYFTFTVNACMLTYKNSDLFKIVPVLILYGVLIEYLQGFIPGRMPSGLDILANTTGVCFGIAVYMIIRKMGWLKVGSNY
jgi:VanZ family protein